MTQVRVVVPTERHVERALRRGESVETRRALRARLVAALAPNTVFAEAREVRVALAEALPWVAEEDGLLAPVAREGGGAWRRTVGAVDAAIGVLRAADVDAAALARAPSAIAGRARMLARAMRALDEALGKAKLVDGRCAASRLARAIADVDPERVRDALGADAAIARWIVRWDAADAAWWSALDAALRRTGGGATIELPAMEARLDTERDRAPLEIVADELARVLDDSPRLVSIAAPLGDLSFAEALDATRVAAVEVRHAGDARAHARAAVDAVRTAIAGGTPVDAIAIALPAPCDETLAPLRDALDEAEIAAHIAHDGARSGLVACALDALSIAARGLGRRDVASLLRSRYVDVRSLGDAAVAAELAGALDETPSAAGDDRVAALEATARAWGGARDARLPELARAVGQALAHVERDRTRAAHASAARDLWRALGLGPRFDDVAESLAGDAALCGLARAAVRAAAADARGWDALDDALDVVVASAAAVGLAGRVVSAETFRHELDESLVVLRSRTAGFAAAVRIAELEELAGEPLDVLVVIDANDGALPFDSGADSLVGDAAVAWLRDRARAAPASPQIRRARALASLAMAASGARRIVFVDREQDDAAALLAPAPIVAWLARSGARVTRWSSSPLGGPPSSAHEAKLRALVGGVGTEAAALLAPDAARRASIERERESLFESSAPARSELRGHLSADAARAAILAAETGGGDRAMSVTAIERIAACPFQGFASQVLRARTGAAVAESPDAREAGEIVHGALAAAFDATAPLWRARPRDRDTIVTRAREACEAFLARAPAASSLRRIALDRVRADVDAVVEWSLTDEEWDFALAEKSFGAPRDEWPPVVIDDGATRVALRGSIDRVDRAHVADAVRAIDYKSSAAAALDAGKRIGDTTFQVAIYARAAAAGTSDVAGLYLPARARALAAFRVPRAHDEAWTRAHADAGGRTALDARALAVVRDLRDGRVTPRPVAESACAVCAHDGGCRKPRFAIQIDDEEDA